MSAQLQVTGEAKIRDIQGPVVANDGVITALDGAANQYVRGDGTLASFPTSSGGGSSVSYYLNGSVNQGTFGGSTYYQMSKNAIVGTGTNFSTSSNGLIAQFITDANDPDVVSIPSGNWNIEFFMNVSASSGSLASFYVEFYKYNGTTFTLLATNVATPEYLTGTTTVDAYFTSVAMPLSAMALTDRLAIRIYANVASKTVTLYTEDNRLCQVITTFSKGILSINGLTDQSQNLTVGTSGTNFNIDSTGDIHTFNLPVASSTNTGKLSSTDWTTFNNKQNALTNPIIGTGYPTGIAYFDGTTSITSEAAFNYDASTNRLGVNTNTPNASIGANAGTDSGYSLLLKNSDNNYNGIGFGTDSTYGNLIQTEKLGTAPARNLTLLNQSGYISVTEGGNLGVNTLNPAVAGQGIDIYSSTSAGLRLHTATSGTTVSDGAGINFSSGNNLGITNYENGTLSLVTNGNLGVFVGANGYVGINGDTPSEALTVYGSIIQTGVFSAMLKVNSVGKLVAAVAGTDYQVPLSNIVTGSSAVNNVALWSGTTTLTGTSNLWYNISNTRLGIGTNNPQRALEIYSATADSHLRLSGSAPSVSMGEAVTGSVYQAKFGLATASGQYVSGAVAGDFVMLSQTGATIFATSSTEKARITSGGNLLVGTTSDNGEKLQVSGVARIVMPSDPLTGAVTSKILSYAPNPFGLIFRGYESGAHSIQSQRENNDSQVYPLVLQPLGGNVGIGTSSPSTKLTVYGGYANFTDGTINIYTGADGAGGLFGTVSNHYQRFITNNTERMRITSSGSVYVNGTTSAIWVSSSASISQVTMNESGFPLVVAKNDNLCTILNRTNSNGGILEFKYNGSTVGSISTNSNSLPSDKNFKKDITDLSLGLNLINKLRPVHYRHKMDNDDEALSNGIIAQELEQSLLECGIEKNSLLMLQHKPNENENESQYWVDYTKIIPILIKSIQELEAKIVTLESKLN